MTEPKSIKHQVADVIVDVCGRLRLKTGWAEGMIIANALKDEGLLAKELTSVTIDRDEVIENEHRNRIRNKT